MAASQLGMIVAPPAGNSLAGINPGLTFNFGAVLAVVGVIIYFFIPKNERRMDKSYKDA